MNRRSFLKSLAFAPVAAPAAIAAAAKAESVLVLQYFDKRSGSIWYSKPFEPEAFPDDHFAHIQAHRNAVPYGESFVETRWYEEDYPE